MFDSKGYFLGVVDSCPEGSFGCVIRRQAPNGKWVRLAASGRELLSLYDVSLSGLYYSGSGCGGDLFFTPLNTLVPEVAIINRTNSGSTYTGDLIYPKSYNAAFSYASYRKGPVCVTASGTASGFLASTTKITFTGPLSFR